MANGNHKKKGTADRSHIMLRYVLVSLFILLFAGAIAWNLFSTTVLHSSDWNEKANAELRRVDTIQPRRGEILAADGTVMVTNLCYYNVRVDYGSDAFLKKKFLKDVKQLSDSMALYFPEKTAEEWEATLKEPLEREKPPRSFKLLSGINYAQLEKFRTFPFFNNKNRYRSGLVEEPFMRRDYPYGAMARRSIGRVGQTAQCREIHGISGLEKALDSLLFGVPGVYKRVPFTRRIGNWTDVPALDGYTVTTTIDITMQDIVEEQLNTMLDSCRAEWGTAVLMEVATGDIKAISNLEYDPASGRYIEAFNRAVVAYEPGSVVKTISMLIALEDGLVDNLDRVIPIGASYAYGGGRAITDSHYNSQLTVAGVLEQSSNIGMARIMTDPRGPYNQDPQAFSRRLESLGFREKMHSGIAEEEMPRFSSNPSRLDMSRMCYGYATAIPPMYTLSIYNAIANGGRYVRPRLVKALSRNGVDSVIPVDYIRERICSEENARKLQYMLSQVVQGSHGTARRLNNKDVLLAGKTGTCYSLDTVTHGYDKSRKRLAFCGFFPSDAPKYSMFVLTYHPRQNMFGAASTSGEVLKNVALCLYSRGLLNDDVDYRADAVETPRPARLSATLADYSASAPLRAALGSANSPRIIQAPQGTVAGTDVPNVLHLSLREALGRLEPAGYRVRFNGSGRVSAQRLADDNTVILTLSTI